MLAGDPVLTWLQLCCDCGVFDISSGYEVTSSLFFECGPSTGISQPFCGQLLEYEHASHAQPNIDTILRVSLDNTLEYRLLSLMKNYTGANE